MSDCEKFKSLIEAVENGECSDKEKALLDAHVLECSACKEELAFALSINNTLRSLPKIEVPDNFLVSLNERLDVEEKIKASAPESGRPSFFRSWKKYSALTACLLLAVLVKVDVWDLPRNSNNNDDVVVQTADSTEVSKLSKRTEEASKDMTVVLPDEASAENEVDLSVSQMPVSQNEQSEFLNSAETSKSQKKSSNVEKRAVKEIQLSSQKPTNTVRQSDPKKQTETPVRQDQSNSHIQADNTTQQINGANVQKPAEIQQNTAENNKSIVMENTQQATNNNQQLPEYMDDKNNVIIPEQTAQVRFDDYEIVVTDEFLEAFSLAEMPSNNVIVASPAAMASIENISMDTDSACPVPTAKHGAGSGSLVVSASDEQKVQSILNKYSQGEENQTFMLTSSDYNSFINELKGEGIEYHDYMIYAEKSNVAFTLIVS